MTIDEASALVRRISTALAIGEDRIRIVVREHGALIELLDPTPPVYSREVMGGSPLTFTADEIAAHFRSVIERRPTPCVFVPPGRMADDEHPQDVPW